MSIDEGLYFALSPYAYHSQVIRGNRCSGCMVVGFAGTYAISAYHLKL